MKDKTPIGFSTNDLYYWDVPLDKKVRFFSKLGANAIELGFNSIKDIVEYEVDDNMLDIFKSFDFISIHAPEIKVEDIERVFEKLGVLCNEIGVKGIVVHYDTIDDFEVFNKSGLPFAIENMDSRKKCGFSIEEFKELYEKYDNLRFVLDLQHIYEHDSSMKLVMKFIEVLGDRLCHMHVSGYSKGFNHVPVCVAYNKKAIENILRLEIDASIILEGLLDENYEESAKKEFGYIRKIRD